MSLLNTKEDAAVFEPVLQRFADALRVALEGALDGLTITITVAKKDKP